MRQKYTISFKDIPVFSISSDGLVEIFNERYMPADIYLEECPNEDIDTRLNNLTNFNSWASSRILNLDRKYAHEILNSFGFSQRLTDKEKAEIAIQTRCLSINDCYWLKEDGEKCTFAEVNLFDNSLKDAVFDVALFGHSPTITNQLPITDLSTDGTAPKAWLRKDDGFYLLKGDVNDSVIRETEASAILRDLGFNVTRYWLSTYRDIPVSVCKCFTSKDINLVKAEWFAIKCMNNDESIADYIYRFQEQFDKMNLADYLIGNTDEHSQNWGFLYDENLNILSLNPPMDYDHAFLGNGDNMCLPMQLLGVVISQKDMAIDIIKRHPDWLKFNADLDLSKYKYGTAVMERLAVLNKCVNAGFPSGRSSDKEISEKDSPADEYDSDLER